VHGGRGRGRHAIAVCAGGRLAGRCPTRTRGADPTFRNRESKEKVKIYAAAEFAKKNAHAKSKGLCARYVRKAMEAGGMDTTGRPVSARDYPAFLLRLGFTEIHPKPGDKWHVADIVVFDPYPGQPGQHGHIQMWVGEYFVSDFVQRRPTNFGAHRLIWPGPSYENSRTKFRCFRWVE
jgi:hypothetical protein